MVDEKRKNPGRLKAYLMDQTRGDRTHPARQPVPIMAVKIASEQYDIEDDYAKNALQTAVEIMAVPGETRERLAQPGHSGFYEI